MGLHNKWPKITGFHWGEIITISGVMGLYL